MLDTRHTFYMNKKFAISALAIGASLLVNTEAAVTQLPSRAAVGANDTLDWSAAGVEFDYLTNPTAVSSVGGRSISVSLPAGSFDGIRLDQGSGWGGHFSVGDALLYTDIQDVWLDLTFASPVFAAALELQPDFLFASGFTARIEAFNTSNTSLGFFDVSSASDDPALLGVASGVADIGRLRLSMVSLTDGDLNDGFDPFPGFAINQMDFRAQVAPPTVPEGGNLTLLSIASFAGLLIVGRGCKRVSA
jgi:hypothetical protein